MIRPASDTGEPGVRFAVWGAGVMGERVARAATALPDVTVAAVVDRDADRASRVAGGVGAGAYTSVAEAVADAGIDAVYIGLPNAAHRDACLEAARLGLHVLVDKPLTTSVREADEIAAAAAASGGCWMMGFSYRFRSEWQRAREIVVSGEIGDPYFVSDNVIEAYRSTPAWYWSERDGGGTLNLQSHHVFDRWEWLLGSRVSAVSAQMLAPRGASTDLSVVLAARFGDGIVGSSALSFGVGYDAEPRVSFTVQGTDGMIELDETRRLTVATADGIREESHDNDWLSQEVSAFIDAVHGRMHGQPSLADGRRAAELAEAAARSGADGTWVSTTVPQERSDR